MANALKFKHTATVPRQQGELARLRCSQGPDYGSIYVLTGNKVGIGRGEDNDVVVSDLKASRRHAEIAWSGTGWSARDAGSANGILHNGQPTKLTALKNGDTITFGETTLEFVSSTEVGTQILMAPPKTPQQIQTENAGHLAAQKRARSVGLFNAPGLPSVGGTDGNFFEKNKRAMAILAVGAILYFFIGDEPKPVRKAAPKTDNAARDLASYLPELPDRSPTGRTAEQFYEMGFREYRERNYLRAKTQFETVLQINPNHKLASLYLENANKAIKDEVKFHLDRGHKEFEAGKLKSARGHFEAVLRLLFREQTDPSYGEAREQLEKVVKIISGEAPST